MEQSAGGAVILTDSIFWLVIYPFLTSKHFRLKFVSTIPFPAAVLLEFSFSVTHFECHCSSFSYRSRTFVCIHLMLLFCLAMQFLTAW